jgi:hypothetical protein
MTEINRKLYSKVALFLLGVSPLVWNANPASAISTNVTIDNTSFAISPSIGVNNAPHNSAIENNSISTIAGAPNFGGGFGDKFASTTGDTFLLLGASNTAKNINQGTTTNTANNGNRFDSNVNVDARYQSFSVDADDVQDGLNFSFDWAFRGTTTDFGDRFVIGFVPTGENAGSEDFKTILSQVNYGDGTFSGNASLTGLTPGNYDLLISLSEATTIGNSAVGFDNFAIADVPSSTTVPFEFSPTMGLLLVGSVFGGSSYLKRRKAAKIEI